MLKLTTLLCFLVMAQLAAAQDKIALLADNSDSIAEIKALELKLSDLIVKSNWDEYATLLASGYVRTIGESPAENRERSIATLRSGEPKIVALIPEHLEVRLYGDTAIVTGSLTQTARLENKVRERHAHFTEVFVRTAGQWLLAATQITFIGK